MSSSGGAGEASPEPRLLAPTADPVEVAEEISLRPRRLSEFVGQAQLKEHLEIMLEAARRRDEPADHMLFAGPPGLGKTSLAGIIANEMGAGYRVTSGPALMRAGDLAALLTNLSDGRRALRRRDPPPGPTRWRRSCTPPWKTSSSTSSWVRGRPRAAPARLAAVHPVGATTRTGLITGPLRDRFGFVARFGLLRGGGPRGHPAPLGRGVEGRDSTRKAATRSPSARGVLPAWPTGS